MIYSHLTQRGAIFLLPSSPVSHESLSVVLPVMKTFLYSCLSSDSIFGLASHRELSLVLLVQ